MFQQFEDINTLLAEVNRDRYLDGEGSSTANRFPIRFVLFDNFRDCSEFVDQIMHIGNIKIQRIDDWLDDEYPDTLITQKKLADKIYSLIKENPTEYRVIMPFSELARFYNNSPEKAEFYTLINTIKGFDTLSSGFKSKQRVYIPVVGLEGKMEHFRDDAQSFIWYYHNPDHQLNYKLILTDNTLYGVSDIANEYTVAENVKKWLNCWQYPELKAKIICRSHAIYSHASYAQPDNAFSYCICHNSYEFLTKALGLDVDCIPWKEEESHYWDKLARLINLSNFKFESFFNEQFGIHNLADYQVFFRQWFENKDDFLRWLLAKFYIHKFCEQDYICKALSNIDNFNDHSFVESIVLSIFSEEYPDSFLKERLDGLKIAKLKGIELSDELQSRLIDKIEKYSDEKGVISALRFITGLCYKEKDLIIKWYKEGKIDDNQLKSIYPDLYYYMDKTNTSVEESWVLDYIDEYKKAKVLNTYTTLIRSYIQDKNQSENTHHAWSNKFYTTRSLLVNRKDIDRFIWIDGLGIDWIPFIKHVIKEHENEGVYVNEVMIATSTLPTRTDVNKNEIVLLGGSSLQKIGDLDEVAHTCREYPKYIIDDIEMVRNAIHDLIQNYPGEKIAIVSDHGMSYLSQLCDGYNLKGFKSDHWGRVATKTSPVNDSKYIVLQDKQTVCALRHESLLAKIPFGMGCHGGVTPEEQLVPIIIISPNKTAISWTAHQKTFDIEEAEPIFEVEIFGIDDHVKPVVNYDGKTYSLILDSGVRFKSERLVLNKNVTKIVLCIAEQTKEFTINVKLAVQEDDLFDGIL